MFHRIQHYELIDNAGRGYRPRGLWRSSAGRNMGWMACLFPARFEGRAWIAEADHQIVRLDMRAADDVSIGWGIVGRIYEGSRFVRKIEDTWLPAEVIFEASRRTLLSASSS
jgi:hypothetical protein